jgi:tetratricopeptide (TPR) repeat protein
VLFRELRDKVGSAHALWNLGHIARSLGEDTHAAEYYDAALALFREQGITFEIASVRHNQAYLAQHQADYVRAAAHLKESLELARALAANDMIAWDLAGLGGVAAALGQSERAARLLGKATALFHIGRHSIDPTEQAEHDGYIATARSQLDEATFEAAWIAGQTMSLEQAIADAIANDTPAWPHH